MAGCAWRWSCVCLLVLLASSSSTSANTTGREESSSTLTTLLMRLLQNLPSLKQALTAPNPAFATSRSAKGLRGDYEQTPAPKLQCFDGLGCLTTGEEFYHARYRTINLMAEPREVVNVIFNVHTRAKPGGFAVGAMALPLLRFSSFRPRRPTKFVIHGYLNGRDMPWLQDVVQALLEAGDFNVVYVDWTGGSLGLYSQAVANARLTALEIANFIKYAGTDPRHVHLIGHSLGAHLAGYVGESVPGLGRITGLDPAEPFFQYMPPVVRLDPSDALLVDVIHTDAFSFSLSGGYGLQQAVGHLDFYPNGGMHQPGCQSPIAAPLRWIQEGKNFSTVWEAVEDAVGCNHIRAVELFLDSIRSPCPFVAFRCTSYDSFLHGDCFSCGDDGSGCVPMGLHADTWQRATPSTTTTTATSRQQLYLATGPQNDFCVYHYRAVLEVGGGKEVVDGYLQLSIIVPNASPVDFDLTLGFPQTLQPGQSRTFLLQHSEDLNTALGAELTWTCYHSRLCPPGPPMARLTLQNIEKSSLSRQGRQLGQAASEMVFCATKETPTQSGETQHFQLCHMSHHSPWQTTL